MMSRFFNILSSLVLLVFSLVVSIPVAVGMTFEEVCALETTINCFGFENENDMYYAWDPYDPANVCGDDPFLKNHPNSRNSFGLDHQSLGNAIAHNTNGKCTYPKRSTDFSVSGNYSLKFIMESETGSSAGGDFMEVFKRTGTPGNYKFARFGPGGEFWFRFKMRQNDALINTVLWGAGGAGSNNGGVKRVIIHGHNSSEILEETIFDGFHRRLPHMYSDSGSEDYGVQDHIGCPYNSGDNNDFNDPAHYPEPPCRKFKANIWRTYQVHVIVAPNGNDGIVELYLDDEPDPIIRVLNANQSTATGPAYTENAVWNEALGNGFGKFSFTFFATGKNPAQQHPDGIMWIDDVVVSHTRVPPITPQSGVTTPPTEPTGEEIIFNNNP